MSVSKYQYLPQRGTSIGQPVWYCCSTWHAMGTLTGNQIWTVISRYMGKLGNYIRILHNSRIDKLEEIQVFYTKRQNIDWLNAKSLNNECHLYCIGQLQKSIFYSKLEPQIGKEIKWCVKRLFPVENFLFLYFGRDVNKGFFWWLCCWIKVTTATQPQRVNPKPILFYSRVSILTAKLECL